MTAPQTDAERLAEIIALLPPAPWAYRPNEYDDWGTVRGAPDDEGRRWVITKVYCGNFTEDELNEHRHNKTDPVEAIARFIALCREAVPALLESHAAREREVVRLREALFATYNLAAVLKYEPDPGKPHPLKDGYYDKVMAEASALLTDGASHA